MLDRFLFGRFPLYVDLFTIVPAAEAGIIDGMNAEQFNRFR